MVLVSQKKLSRAEDVDCGRTLKIFLSFCLITMQNLFFAPCARMFENQFFETLKPRPLRIDCPSIQYLLPCQNMIVLGHMENGPLAFCLLRWFKVIGTDKDRSATYIPSVMHSNHGHISSRFRHKRRFRRRIANFSHPSGFNDPAEQFLLELCNGGEGKN